MPILSTHGRRSAHYEPADRDVRTAVDKAGAPSMYNSRTKVLSVPIAFADRIDAALWRAGREVDVVLGLGAS